MTDNVPTLKECVMYVSTEAVLTALQSIVPPGMVVTEMTETLESAERESNGQWRLVVERPA